MCVDSRVGVTPHALPLAYMLAASILVCVCVCVCVCVRVCVCFVHKVLAEVPCQAPSAFLPSFLLAAPVRQDDTKFSAYNAPPTPPPPEDSPPSPPAKAAVPNAVKQAPSKHKPPRKTEKKGQEDSLPSATEVLRSVCAVDAWDKFVVLAVLDVLNNFSCSLCGLCILLPLARCH